MVVAGVTEAFWETGTEGVYWAVQGPEREEHPYEGLHLLGDGDHLVLTDDKGVIHFAGVIVIDTEEGFCRYPRNPQYGQPLSNGMWVHWTQAGYTANEWGALFLLHAPALRARLTPKEGKEHSWQARTWGQIAERMNPSPTSTVSL